MHTSTTSRCHTDKSGPSVTVIRPVVDKLLNGTMYFNNASSRNRNNCTIYLTGACIDTNIRCHVWAQNGYCTRYPQNMYQCKKSCNKCAR